VSSDAVTACARLHFSRLNRFRLTLNSLPNPGVYRHVEDACIVGDTIILGYNNGPSQITFVPITVRVLHLRVAANSCSIRQTLLAE